MTTDDFRFALKLHHVIVKRIEQRSFDDLILFSRCMEITTHHPWINASFVKFEKIIECYIIWAMIQYNWMKWSRIDLNYLLIFVFEVKVNGKRNSKKFFASMILDTLAHWLAIGGQQPLCHENPIIEQSSISNSTSSLKKKSKRANPRSHILHLVGDLIGTMMIDAFDHLLRNSRFTTNKSRKCALLRILRSGR